jgi:hypothetical protein
LPCHSLLRNYLLVNNHQTPTSNSSLSLKTQHPKKNLNFEIRTSKINENLGVLEMICEKESKGCEMDLTYEGKRTKEKQETESKGDSKGCCSDYLNNKKKINLSC